MSRQADAYQIEVVTPYRLDLTVSVLRRSSTNIVDLFTRDGDYVRALPIGHEDVTAYVRQTSASSLVARFEGARGKHHEALATVRRILGVDRDITRFERTAKRIPWLRSLAMRMRGVKPPRYPTLWEACVNAILFQQVSLASASAIARRFALLLAPNRAASRPYAFPSVDRFTEMNDDVLRTAGLSVNKLETLRRVAGALRSSVLDEVILEALPSREATAVLRSIKGIGPWTAAVILLRGLGRLDVFPMNDSSVQHNLAIVAGSARVEIDDVLDLLGPERGMLYYYLLLARLDARDDIGRVSSSFSD